MESNQRYERHYRLKGFGKVGQQKLSASRILVVGAGGLGCPALQYLVAAGVGTVAVVDHDKVSLSNLQRQVLYKTSDIGFSKAEVAVDRLKSLNREINISAYPVYISAENAVELITGHDVVIDCTDNFETRYMLGDVCMLMEIPLVFGAIYQYEGQVAVFNVRDESGIKTTYRHLFPEPPGTLEVPDCNEAGVLGVLPGVIGILQATETIKILTGIGQALINKMMTINLLDYQSFTIDIPSEMPDQPFGSWRNGFKCKQT